MTNDELKTALLNGGKVKHDNITYKCVSAIIYRNNNGKINVSAELTDRNTRSISIVDPKKVEFIKGEQSND